MKLVLTIVNNQDSAKLTRALNKDGFSVTRLATTGGFLGNGNTTLLIGTQEENISVVIDTIKKYCSSRKQISTTPPSVMGGDANVSCMPIEVDVGGATVFVLDVERFEKL